MKTHISIVFCLLLVQNVFAGDNFIAFRLAYETEKPDTVVSVDKQVGKLFVRKYAIITTKDISEAKVIIDETEPPDWLAEAIKESGGKIVRKPKVNISFTLTASGRDIFARTTAENIGNRIAIFLNNELLIAPQILESIPSGKFLIWTLFTEAQAQAVVDEINKRSGEDR